MLGRDELTLPCFWCIRYGYKFAHSIIELAKVQKVPTDIENWTGRRQADTRGPYVHDYWGPAPLPFPCVEFFVGSCFCFFVSLGCASGWVAKHELTLRCVHGFRVRKHRTPEPDFVADHTLYETKEAPDDRLAPLEIWYRFFDEGAFTWRVKRQALCLIAV